MFQSPEVLISCIFQYIHLFFSRLRQKVPFLQKENHWDNGFKVSRGIGTGIEEDCLNTEERRF